MKDRKDFKDQRLWSLQPLQSLGSFLWTPSPPLPYTEGHLLASRAS